ncbi:MAG: putative amino acid permease YhdG [Candidatus Thorarchaeota archaeon AB_25]|nr:MAG: putative amino acid permease YhdG [Candidatus Thorarchaeota archaeon AB_25]
MTETIDDEQASGKFGRHLGLVGATNIGLGAMLGGGIYVISGTAAGMIGPALVFAYFFTGVLAMFTAVNYAEIASSIPKQGGGYTFAHDTVGGLPAFLAGWFLMIGNIVACGLYALAVAHTLVVFIPDGTQYIALIALIIIAITFVTNTVSVKSVSGILGILNIAQAIILFTFVAIGLLFIDPSNLTPIFAENAGLPAFMSTVSFIYISFVGFELVTSASEEVKEPAKNVPRAIFLTVAIGTGVYMAASLVLVGVVPFTVVAETFTPIADVFAVMLGQGALILGLAGMAASNYAALNATFLAGARIVYSMGRDRFLPKSFDRVNDRLKTPIPALILVLILVSLFALSADVVLVAQLAVFGYLIAQAIVNFSVIILRRKGLSVPGTFKAPLFPVLPLVGFGICLLLIPSLDYFVLQLGGLLTLIGFLVFLIYGWKRNKAHVDWLNGENGITHP